MNRNKRQISKEDVVRIMLCVFIGLFLTISALTGIVEQEKEKLEYQVSFRVGEEIGKVVSIIEVGHIKGNIEDNGQYLRSMTRANLMIQDLTKESMDAFLKVSLPLAGVELENHYDLIKDEEAFWDGYYMHAFDKSIVFARETKYITGERAQELFDMREEICAKPTHKKAEEYSNLMLELFFFSEEEKG